MFVSHPGEALGSSTYHTPARRIDSSRRTAICDRDTEIGADLVSATALQYAALLARMAQPCCKPRGE